MESPMKYPKTKRNGVLFVFLNIITLSIFSLFVLGKVRKEVNSFAKGKLAPYWAMWLLGFITLGLAPLIWCACLARRVNDKAEELGVKLGDFMMPIRMAVTGSRVSPPLIGSIAVLGKERALARIEKTLATL